jgi:hypothetical protein
MGWRRNSHLHTNGQSWRRFPPFDHPHNVTHDPTGCTAVQSRVDLKFILLALWLNAGNSCNGFAIMAQTTTTLMGDLAAAAAGTICSGMPSGVVRSRETRFG